MHKIKNNNSNIYNRKLKKIYCQITQIFYNDNFYFYKFDLTL